MHTNLIVVWVIEWSILWEFKSFVYTHIHVLLLSWHGFLIFNSYRWCSNKEHKKHKYLPSDSIFILFYLFFVFFIQAIIDSDGICFLGGGKKGVLNCGNPCKLSHSILITEAKFESNFFPSFLLSLSPIYQYTHKFR